MTVIRGFSIDPRGRWTQRQLNRVLPTLNEEARLQGLVFRAIDITTHQDECHWFLLSARCIRHDHPLEIDSICELCAADPELTLILSNESSGSNELAASEAVHLGILADLVVSWN